MTTVAASIKSIAESAQNNKTEQKIQAATALQANKDPTIRKKATDFLLSFLE